MNVLVNVLYCSNHTSYSPIGQVQLLHTARIRSEAIIMAAFTVPAAMMPCAVDHLIVLLLLLLL